MLGELLGWPHASGVVKLALAGEGFRVEREFEGGREIQEGVLPAVVSCDKGLNEPRYAALKGIMQAKKKPLAVTTPAAIGIEPAALAEPCVAWEALELPAARRAGRRIEGPPEQAAAELARLLREEARVI
jgi:electron transfer flavoprotein beta subunit